MTDEKNNTGLGKPNVPEAPSSDIPNAPLPSL